MWTLHSKESNINPDCWILFSIIDSEYFGDFTCHLTLIIPKQCLHLLSVNVKHHPEENIQHKPLQINFDMFDLLQKLLHKLYKIFMTHVTPFIFL